MQATRSSPRNRLPYLVFALFLALALMPASAFGQAGPPPGVGEDEGEEATNSLSMPVVYFNTDGTTVTATAFVPDTEATKECVTQEVVDENNVVTTFNVCYVIQGTDTWTADTDTYAGTTLPADTYVDWGDNMAQEWEDGQFVRIESAVYVPLAVDLNADGIIDDAEKEAAAMQGFLMVDILAADSPLSEEQQAAILNELGLPQTTKELWAVQDGDPDPVGDTDEGDIDPVPMLFSLVEGEEGELTFQYDADGDPYAMVDFGDVATFYVQPADGEAIPLEIAPEVNQSGKFIYGGQLQTDDPATDVTAGDYTYWIAFGDGETPVYTTPVDEDTVLTIVTERTGGPPDGGDAPDHAGPGGDTGGGGGSGPTDPGQGDGGGQGGPPQQPEGDEDAPGQGGTGNAPTDPGQGGGNAPQEPDTEDALTPPADDGQGGPGYQGGSDGSGNGGPETSGPPEGRGEDSDHEGDHEETTDPTLPVEEDGPPEGRGGGQPDVTGPPAGSGEDSDHEGDHEETAPEESGS